MSLLALLIVAGIVAALAFFLAGLLLRSSPAASADAGQETDSNVASGLDRLREQLKDREAALETAKSEREAEASARRMEAEKRGIAERERDEAHAEANILAASERTLAERLHVAEDKNRAAFEREREHAEAWSVQLQAMKAEQKRQEFGIRAELEQLRAEIGQREAERAGLVEDVGRHEARAGELEREVLARRAEAASRSEGGEQQELATRLRVLEEMVEQEREQGKAALEALRAAEARLADLGRLVEENSQLREQQAESAHAAKWQAGREDDVRDVKVELAAAQAKLVEHERILEENRKLRDEAAELRQFQDAGSELERLTAEHKRLRLDAELMARNLQELIQGRNELVSLRAQAAEAASLVEEVAYLRRREKDLEAVLYASGVYASREMPAVDAEPVKRTSMSDMETNLNSLVGADGPRTAVLADAKGFLIASAGESFAQEGLAAFVAVAGEMVSRSRQLLPLAAVDSVRVTDANRIVLTCHLFESAGEGLGVATIGQSEPEAVNTSRAIAELAAVVSGGEIGGGEEAE